MGDRKDTGFPSFLKGDQDGGWRHPSREEPFLMDRGFIRKISKPGKAGEEWSAFADALDRGGMPEHRSWDFLRGERDCLGSC